MMMIMMMMMKSRMWTTNYSLRARYEFLFFCFDLFSFSRNEFARTDLNAGNAGSEETTKHG